MLKKIQRAALQQIRTVNRTLTTTIEDSDVTNIVSLRVTDAFGTGDILFGSNVISDSPSRVDYLSFPPGSFE